MWFVNEISQSKTEELTISLFRYFVKKPPLTIDYHKTNKTRGQQKLFYITKRYLKARTSGLQSLVEQPIFQNKMTTLSKTSVCEVIK